MIAIPRGTQSLNPICSSKQSVSRGILSSCMEKPVSAAACAGPARRHGRQRRAGLVNITPTAGNISVEPYPSTAVPARRFASVLALLHFFAEEHLVESNLVISPCVTL